MDKQSITSAEMWKELVRRYGSMCFTRVYPAPHDLVTTVDGMRTVLGSGVTFPEAIADAFSRLPTAQCVNAGEAVDKCESCGEPATTFDNPDVYVPLCEACRDGLAEDIKNHHEECECDRCVPPAQPSAAEPKAEGEDERVQRVYEMLVDDVQPNDPEQHWEGFLARRIVDALFPTLPESGADAKEAEHPSSPEVAARMIADNRWWCDDCTAWVVVTEHITCRTCGAYEGLSQPDGRDAAWWLKKASAEADHHISAGLATSAAGDAGAPKEADPEASALPVGERFVLYFDDEGDFVIEAQRSDLGQHLSAHGETPTEAVQAMCRFIQMLPEEQRTVPLERESAQQAELAALRSKADKMAEALRLIKIRIHYIGMPQEPMWEAEGGMHPDWREQIAALEEALSAYRQEVR